MYIAMIIRKYEVGDRIESNSHSWVSSTATRYENIEVQFATIRL